MWPVWWLNVIGTLCWLCFLVQRLKEMLGCQDGSCAPCGGAAGAGFGASSGAA